MASLSPFSASLLARAPVPIPVLVLSLAILLAILPAQPQAQPVGTVILPADLAVPGAAVQWVRKVPAFCEGPAWDGASTIYFTEQHGKDSSSWPIWKVEVGEADGTTALSASVFVEASDQANGLAFDPEGRLVACQRRKVGRFDANGRAVSLADSSAALPFSFANDLTFGSDGSFYFTALDSLVYRVGSDSRASVAARGLEGANGILWVEEAGTLYVADAADSQVVRFRVGPDGSLSGRERHFRINRPDGMAMDERRNLYVSSAVEGRIRVFGPAGDSLGHIALHPPAPWEGYKRGPNGNASNCEFGGIDGRTLFINGDGGLYALRLKAAGRTLPEPTRLRPPAGPVRRAISLEDYASALHRALLAGTWEGRQQAPTLLGRWPARP